MALLLSLVFIWILLLEIAYPFFVYGRLRELEFCSETVRRKCLRDVVSTLFLTPFSNTISGASLWDFRNYRFVSGNFWRFSESSIWKIIVASISSFFFFFFCKRQETTPKFST
ncbi:hypothetical protein TorRG33x02_177870 [Trema orientale]|uniref:Transmembrane protein n=1 Tax=Trema orientale TaxID=63057 RepID=A0A2P5ELL2_TREOI|nr:hypothetical protein TorRG33x02_177870 [Trema orientale]